MPVNQQLERVVATIDTQGDTGTASQIKLAATRDNSAITEQFAVRVHVCNDGTWADSTNATIAVASGFGTLIATNQAGKDLEFVSSITSATETLTISGVVSDTETVTLGTQVYEFDTDSSVTGSNVAVDISSYAVAAQGTMTVDTQPTALDAFEIDGKGYVFVADGTESTDGEISVGADLAAAKLNIVDAINGTDHNTAHPSVTAAAFATNDCVITAVALGVSGNSLTSTESYTAVGNVFDATTLGTTTLGSECSAANAVTALAAAITADAGAVVTAVDGTGDTVDVTAIAAGYAGDSIASTETMANGAFGAATLSGAAIASEIFVDLTDGSAETVTVRLGSPCTQGLAANYSLSDIDVTHAAP